MNDERDPQIEALFAETAPETPNGDFADRVMTGVAQRRRSILLGRLSVLVLIVALEFLLNAPLNGVIGSFVEMLATPVIPIQAEWMSTILAPINSIAGVIGGLLLFLHFLYRKVLR